VKSLTTQSVVQLLVLAAVSGFTLAIVQLARERRSIAEHEAERIALLNRVGAALTRELDETRLLHLIAETARDLTGAGFAAFTLRPVDALGQPLVASEGSLFHLAAVVGVTKDQERLFHRMPLGGEGLLAPIFRQGVPVLVSDALAHIQQPAHTQSSRLRDASPASREAARQAAFDYAHGQLGKEGLHSLGVPRGHPLVRSFLGVPLLDRNRQVSGGLLLGHEEPGRFTQDDEALLVGLAAQAAIALENARLYRTVQMRAQELDAIFESIADGVTLVDPQGGIVRENRSAQRVRAAFQDTPAGEQATEALLHAPAQRALRGETGQDSAVTVVDGHQETREYIVTAAPLRSPPPSSGPLPQSEQVVQDAQQGVSGAVVVWHDVTEAHRLLIEQRVHAETEARRAFLQLVLDALPSSVYLVRGRDARLVLANRAAATLWGAAWPPGQPMSDFLTEHGIRIFGIDGRALASDQLATVRAVQHGETVYQHQEIIRHLDGTSLPVLVNAVALDTRDLGASPLETTHPTEEVEPAAIVVNQDVTALKEAERLKDEFIGIAAHELRAPLTILKGFAQTLMMQTARGKGPKLVDWQVEALQGIDQATLRLVELTEDLLDVTRLQAGRLALQVEPADLIALARRVVARLQMTTEQHTIYINTSVEHLVVDVDPRRIEQVLTNLISNAIKYSPEGGYIEVSIREEAETKSALLSVCDHGIGIPAQQQSLLFGRFARAENARAYGIGGTGLGLYLCRELIERHGGRIWFESVEGQGSTFFIALPLTSYADLSTDR
jgi:two-component system phosphate regulon sensor histidine kinase PhoR